MVFLGTPNLSAPTLFVMPFSMCDSMSQFPFKVFVSSLRLTEFFVLAALIKKTFLFSFTVEIIVLIQIQIYSEI